VPGLYISLAWNLVSHISLDVKSVAESKKKGSLKFHVPVRLFWDCRENKTDISINTLIDSGAEV